jgi:hypothetical protein
MDPPQDLDEFSDLLQQSQVCTQMFEMEEVVPVLPR